MILNNDLLNAPRTKFIIKKGINIGNHVRISWESQIFDSNFHYIQLYINHLFKFYLPENRIFSITLPPIRKFFNRAL